VLSSCRRRERLAPGLLALGVVAIAVAVRAVAVGSRLHNDDAYSWYVATAPGARLFLSRLAASENTPPLFYLLLSLVPGSGAGWLRLPAALPGVLMCGVVYLALRRRLGESTALLAALLVAVDPFLITYSDLARGFMLGDLALLGALWALLSLGERETRARWVAFIACGVAAVYTEYDSVIVVTALIISALWAGRPRRRPTVLAGALVVASLVLWIPEIVRGQRQVGITKLNPMNARPSLSGLRDMFATLTLGERGGTSSATGRWGLFLVMLAAAGGGVVVVRRSWETRGPESRRTLRLLVATGVLTLAGYAVVGVFGVDVFTQRYLTILVGLAGAAFAAAVTGIDRRWLTITVAVALAALGLFEIARRNQAQYEPDFAPVATAAAAARPRTILTNSPIVLYYLRSVHPVFDRPYNLGPGRAGSCRRPCLVIDDTRVPGGTPRAAGGTQTAIGPYLLMLEP
jgi:4-amino-4-deoxy-L-arabinose transferase-like glycosyltransferase